jgi:lipid-A-disaccharide synthase
MRAAGCDLVVNAKELSVVGITEILPRVPRIYAEFRKLVRAMEERRPDAGIVIDSPAFNFRVARELDRRGVPVIYYVAPQLWAWRERRVRLMRYVKKALVIFPFEEQWYRERGVDAEFVGHPLAFLPNSTISREEFARAHGLDVQKRWIALLPGSRRREVGMNLPAMLEATRRFPEYQLILPVASTLDARWLDGKVRQHSASVKLVRDVRAALAHSRAAVVASGTATVEATLMGTPMVVVYRVSPLTWLFGRPLVKVKHFAMVNLVAGREIVPELIQSDFTAENVASRLAEVLAEGAAREKMIGGLEEVRECLRSGGSARPAAEKAADEVLRVLGVAA